MSHGHGKVILFGEHAVVYGRPALAQAIDCAALVTAKRTSGPYTTLEIEPWGVGVDTGAAENDGRERLQQALRAVRALYPDELELSLRAQLRIPPRAGLGSSAALGLAVLRAMDEARGCPRTDSENYERSFVWERVFHGNPAGVDAAMATYGGVAVFRKGEPLSPLRGTRACRLVAANSGSRPGAREMIAVVRRQYEADRGRVERIFDAMAALVAQAIRALALDDTPGLGELLTENHALLADLQVSTEKLDRMVVAALEAGALGAKLTGAGGGGCMIALADSAASQARIRVALAPFGAVYDVLPPGA